MNSHVILSVVSLLIERYHFRLKDNKCLIIATGSVARNEYIDGWSDIDIFFVELEPLQGEIANTIETAVSKALNIDLKARIISFENIQKIAQIPLSIDVDYLDFIPLGTAKLLDALRFANTESKLLYGNLEMIDKSFYLLDMKFVYLSGIRDAIQTWNLYSHLNLQEKPILRKLHSQMINTVRMMLRLRGNNDSLSHSYLYSIVNQDIFEEFVRKIIMDNKHFRESLAMKNIYYFENLISNLRYFSDLIDLINLQNGSKFKISS